MSFCLCIYVGVLWIIDSLLSQDYLIDSLFDFWEVFVDPLILLINIFKRPFQNEFVASCSKLSTFSSSRRKGLENVGPIRKFEEFENNTFQFEISKSTKFLLLLWAHKRSLFTKFFCLKGSAEQLLHCPSLLTFQLERHFKDYSSSLLDGPNGLLSQKSISNVVVIKRRRLFIIWTV